MRTLPFRLAQIICATILLLFSCYAIAAQSPLSIQFFVPGGSLPARPLRFTLTFPDAHQEMLSTDAKGKFSLANDQVHEGDYGIYVEGDKRTFETTSLRLVKLNRMTASYLPIFLRPLRNAAPPKATADVAEYDAKAPAEARAAYEQAMKLLSEAKPNEAISEFTRALAFYPQHLRALNELGVLYLKLNRSEEATAAFTQALSLSTRFYPPRLNLALLRHRQERNDEAIQLFNQLLQDQPALSAARVTYAEALIATQQWDEAEQQLREALKDTKLENADRSNAHLKLGVKLQRDTRYQAALTEFEKAIALTPQSALARLSLGAVLTQMKKLPEAERELLKAYELGGKSVTAAQLLLGELYYRQQKYEAALRAFEQYLADTPNAPNLVQVKQAIEHVKAALKQK